MSRRARRAGATDQRYASAGCVGEVVVDRGDVATVGVQQSGDNAGLAAAAENPQRALGDLVDAIEDLGNRHVQRAADMRAGAFGGQADVEDCGRVESGKRSGEIVEGRSRVADQRFETSPVVRTASGRGDGAFDADAHQLSLGLIDLTLGGP
jgi:hypothetical protein